MVLDSYFCIVDAYYCFEYIWIAKGLDLKERAKLSVASHRIEAL